MTRRSIGGRGGPVNGDSGKSGKRPPTTPCRTGCGSVNRLQRKIMWPAQRPVKHNPARRSDMATPRVLILRAPGANCDRETQFAFERAGALAERVHINQL